MNDRKIAVIGAGVVGCPLAAHLAKAGSHVYLVDINQDILNTAAQDGIQISGVKELESAVTEALPSIQALYDKELDYVFICLKSNVLPLVLPQIQKLDNKRTCVISFQNGIDTEELLATVFSRHHLFRAVVNYAGAIIAPAAVKMTFFHPPNYVGGLIKNDDQVTRVGQDLAVLLTEAGLDTEYTTEIKKKVWQKAILNSSIMPTSVITGLTMGRIMNLAETREIVISEIKTYLAIARAEGYLFESSFLDLAVQYLSKAGEHKTSMLMDFEAGHPLEIDFLNIKIQEYAEKHHIPSETNKVLIALIRGLLRRRETLKAEKN